MKFWQQKEWTLETEWLAEMSRYAEEVRGVDPDDQMLGDLLEYARHRFRSAGGRIPPEVLWREFTETGLFRRFYGAT